MPNSLNVSPQLISAYQDEISKSSSIATAKRKNIAIKRFFDWAHKEGHIPQNPFSSLPSTPQGMIVGTAERKKKIKLSTVLQLGGLGLLMIALFFLLKNLQIPIPFIFTPAKEGIPESRIQTIPGKISEASPLPQDSPIPAGHTEINQGNPEETPTIPGVGGAGNLILAGDSPTIDASTGDLLIEGQTLTLKTTDGGDGNIEINPDGGGIAHFLFEGTGENFLNAQAPNLTRGSLYYGIVANNATGYDLLKLQSGSKPVTRLSVDALGNTYIGGNLNVANDIKTAGTTRLTSTGALTNITGYSQNSGNFTINQNPGDFASIIKKGTALSDVLTLTLDERPKPLYSNSDYSTLVLKRYDGSTSGYALFVDEGNARFDGQLQLGRFSSNPSSIGQGSLVFNTVDNKVYVFDGTQWVSIGSNFWQRNSGVLAPLTTTDDLAIGGTTNAAPFYVAASTGNITTSGDLAINGGDITSSAVTFNLLNSTVTTLNIGGAATTINQGPTGSGTSSIVMSGGSADTGCTLDGSTGNFTCSGIIAGSAATSKWNAITNPDGDLTLTMAAFNTTFNWDPGPDTTETNFSLTTQGEDTIGTDQDQVLLALSQTSNGVDVTQAADALLTFTNNDANDPVVNAIRFDAGAAGTDFTYGINFDAASIGTAELILQNSETIDNVTDNQINLTLGSSGTLLLTSTTTATISNSAGDITLDGFADIILDADGADLIFKDGGATVANFTNSSTDLTIDIAGGQLYLANGDTLNIGGVTGLTYNALSDSGTTGHGLATDNDLLIEGDLELDGILYLDGRTISNPSGTASIILPINPITTAATLTGQNWLVENTANVGQAALMVNQTKAGDLFTASVSGVTRATITNPGDLVRNGYTNIRTPATIVDTFVYDTEKDTDGGIWRNDERGKAASWYNETIDNNAVNCVMDTDDRCGSREFPERAIIVASTAKLYIFDAKTNSVWMDFSKGATTTEQMIGPTTNSTGSSVWALNGKIYYANNGSVGGLYVIDLINDRSYKYDATDDYIGSKTVANRNSTVTFLTGPSSPIVNATINDIIPRIINSKTYVAVGTDAGMSIINENDNAVYDYADVATDDYNSVWLDRDGNLWALNETSGQLEKWTRVTSDIADENPGTPDNIWDESSTPALSVSVPTINVAPGALFLTDSTSDINGDSPTIYVGHSSGLTVISTKNGDETNGSAKYYSKDFITEEMIGDIRGMWPFTESSGSLADASVKANFLEDENPPTYSVSAVRGTGLTFDNAADHLCSDTNNDGICDNDTDFDFGTGSFSVSTWFKHSTSAPPAQPNDDVIIDHTYNTTPAAVLGWKVWMNAAGTITFGIDDDATWTNSDPTDDQATSTQTYLDNIWHHLVAVKSNTSAIYLYIDGKLVASDTSLTATGTLTGTGVIMGVGADCSVGAACATGANFWDGQLDELTIATEALTSSQINHIYEVGYRALQNHTASRITGVTGADTYQTLLGAGLAAVGVNRTFAVAVDDSNQFIYAGTNDGSLDKGGVTVLGIDSDSAVDLYDDVNNTTKTDDAGTQFSGNDVVAIGLTGKPCHPYNLGSTTCDNQSVLAIAGTNDTATRVWMESAETSLYSILSSLTSSTLTKAKLVVDLLADKFVTAGIAVGDAVNTVLSGFGASSIVGALNELKNTNKNISHNDYLAWANHYIAKGEGTDINTNETLNGLFFDTFSDATKMDGTNSTSSATLQYSDPKASVRPDAPFRVGLIGGQTYATSTTDNAGSTYLGSNTVNDIYYYDRTRDSSPEVLIELGIDPNWYNGVTLSVATSSAQLSQNSTIPHDKNPNLTTLYNGSLIKATGTDSSPRTIYITIKSPTTFDWTNYQGDSATGTTITPGTAQTLGSTGVSVTFTQANYNVGDIFKIASWYIEASGSTKGAKAQFPERSNIIATASSVDIIDADTQKLWMNFAQGTNFALGADANNNPSATQGLNGKVYVTANGSSATGLYTLDFVHDAMFRQNATDYRLSDTAIYGRNAAVTYNVINTSNTIVTVTANDVDAAVIPNQPTQNMTVSGWGYIQGNGTATISESVNLPYKFNNVPTVETAGAGYLSSTTPTSLSSCTTSIALNGVTVAVSSTSTSSFTLNMGQTVSTFASGTYFCYTWTATGAVSPKQFVAVATGATSADGGDTVINETEGSRINLLVGSQNANAIWQTKIALTNTGELYSGFNDSTANNTQLIVYYGVHGLPTETAWANAHVGSYGVMVTAGLFPTILGTATGTEQIKSVAVTKGASTIDGTSNTIYVGTTTGATVIQEKQSKGNWGQGLAAGIDGIEEFDGSVKYYTKDYISEEMVGGIRAMWPLNNANASSDFEDVSIAAETLTGTNITANGDSVSGVRNTATDFDGSTEYMSCTDANCGGTTELDIGTGSWSVGAWIKTTMTGSGMILSKGTSGTYSWEIATGLITAGKISYRLYQAGGTAYITIESNTAINDNNWHHVVGTWNPTGTILSIYIDGSFEGSTTTTAGSLNTDSTADFNIARRADAFGFFTGSIDEPFVTATALTAGQIKHMYQVGYRALQSHATTLGGGAADANQELGFISTGTSSVGAVAPDYNNQFVYVGLNSTTLGGLSKVQLDSDTNIKTFNSSANVPTGGTLLIDEDVTSLGVGYQLEAAGSAASGVKSMAPDNNANGTVGSLFSKTQTLASGTKFAFLWTSVNLDSQDATSALNVYACNAYGTKALCDSNNAWVLGTLVQTDSNQTPPEREYSFSFPSAGSSMTFKFDLTRGSTKTNTYMARYGATWGSSVGGADIAERYRSVEPVYPGDILTIAGPVVDGEAAVSLAKEPYDRGLIGIVTTNPGIVMDENLVDLNFNAASRNSPDRPAVALAGRIPVKVSTINGPIGIGDYITSSSIPGVGVKAVKAGATVAKALDSFDCPEGSETNICQGEVLALVNISWYDPDVYLTGIGNLQISKALADAQNYVYKVVRVTVNGTEEVVDRIGTFGQVVAANIKAGAIEVKDVSTESLTAALDIISPEVKTNLISPLADSTGIAIKLGNEATPSGELSIQNVEGEEVASINSQGDASFSGEIRAREIHSDNLDAIEALLRDVEENQNLLSEVSGWSSLSATDSASLNEIVVDNLFVTGQAAINTLSLSESLAIGSDFVIQSQDSSINTLSSPLKIQSLAMAPIELMAGLVTIDTEGNVNIAGDLNVAGKITAPVAEFNDLYIQNLTIAASEATASAEIAPGDIETNSTIGKAIIPADTEEITIRNPNVNDYTLVYVTPTSSTQNHVLYVKSKGNGFFSVGFTNPIDVDTDFNWWIVETNY